MKLEQAARALLAHWDTPAWKYLKPTGDLMADLREALAEQVHTPYCKQAPMCKTPCGNSDCVEQAEQEPVAWKDLTYGNLHHQDFGNSTPLYANPVRTKDLTDVEIAALVQRHTIDGKIMPFALCEAVIAADREKNK